MTVEVIIDKIKYLHIHNVSIHINLYQNRFKNECVRRLFLNSRTDVKTEFFVRCRRTYVLNKSTNSKKYNRFFKKYIWNKFLKFWYFKVVKRYNWSYSIFLLNLNREKKIHYFSNQLSIKYIHTDTYTVIPVISYFSLIKKMSVKFIKSMFNNLDYLFSIF